MLSGAAAERVPELVQRVEDHIGAVGTYAGTSAGTDVGEYELGERVLAYMHENVLSRYEELQTRIDILLVSGRFNCVSSAVMYAILARSVGLSVAGISTTDHAFCAVVTRDGLVDVETTTEHGYDPGSRKEFSDAFGRITGYTYVPPSNYAQRTQLDEKGLLALILQNRVSRLEAAMRFSESVPLAVDRYALRPTDSVREDMYREFTNYAALLNEQRRYEAGSAFLELAIAEHGDSQQFDSVRNILAYNAVIAVMNDGDLPAARRLIAEAVRQGRLEPASADSLREMVVQRELAVLMDQLSFNELVDRLGSMWEAEEIDQEIYRTFGAAAYGREAGRRADTDGFLAAAALLADVPAPLRDHPDLVRARSVYLYNYAADAHNEFARHFNAGNVDKAAKVLAEALENAPESTLLKRDQAALQRYRQRNR